MPLKLTSRLAKQVNKTVRTTCANYVNGNCLLLDDGDSHPCIQNMYCLLIRNCTKKSSNLIKNKGVVLL